MICPSCIDKQFAALLQHIKSCRLDHALATVIITIDEDAVAFTSHMSFFSDASESTLLYLESVIAALNKYKEELTEKDLYSSAKPN